MSFLLSLCRMTRQRWLAVGCGVILVANTVGAGDVERHAAVVAPYCDAETILVARLDMNRVDVDGAVALLRQLLPIREPERQRIEMVRHAANAWLTRFRQAGGRDLCAVISLADVGLADLPSLPLLLVVPVAADGKADALAAAIPTSAAKGALLQTVARIPENGPLVFGRQATIDRLRRLAASGGGGNDVEADLTAAFAAVRGAALQIVFRPSDDQRRVIREMFPQLPKPLNALNGATLANGVLWKAVGIDLPPQFAIRSVVHAQDAAAATRLAAVWKQLLDFAATQPLLRAQVPMIDQIVPLLEPAVEGDNVVVTMKQEAIEPIVKRLLLPAVEAARSVAFRQQRMNQFKQLALAMHNWAAAHGKKVAANRRVAAFPPAAITDKNGKPLLSWRVALLPYLEQQSLYDQFRLDQPWDSPHNKKLIQQMPSVYRDHGLDSILNAKRLAPGHTTYVVPVGEGLVFGRRERTALSEIKDGTSATVMLVEVVPELATVWTKPADWKVPTVRCDPKTLQVTQGDPRKGVQRTDRNSFTVALCDGSVRMISNDIDPSVFWHLLTRAGGEPIDFRAVTTSR